MKYVFKCLFGIIRIKSYIKIKFDRLTYEQLDGVLWYIFLIIFTTKILFNFNYFSMYFIPHMGIYFSMK